MGGCSFGETWVGAVNGWPGGASSTVDRDELACGVTKPAVPEGWLEGVTTPVNGSGWSSGVFIIVDCEVSPGGGTWVDGVSLAEETSEVDCKVSVDRFTIEQGTNEAE